MCHVFSWLEPKEEGLPRMFITKDELNTEYGKKLLRSTQNYDAVGHGFARKFFGRTDKKLKSYNVYLDEENVHGDWPEDIVIAIKKGKFNHAVFADHGEQAFRKLVNREGLSAYKKSLKKLGDKEFTGTDYLTELAQVMWGNIVTKNKYLKAKYAKVRVPRKK